MRNITNSNTSKVFVNTITATSPLVFSASSSSASNIALTGLSGFGSAGEVIKVNSSGDGLEYGSESIASQWVNDSGNLRPILTTTYSNIQLKRTDTGQVGFKLTNSSYSSEFKQFGDNTIITTFLFWFFFQSFFLLIP